MSEIAKKETRTAYGEALAELGAIDPSVVVMDADLSGSTKTALFRKAFPDRFFNTGIAEGNMAGVAAGLAASGFKVFISSFAMFAAGRAFEQVRNAIAHTGLNVKVCATHAGITVGEDGATHQCLEDLAIMRAVPGMTVICPADPAESRAALFAAAEYNGPVYLRFGRSAVPYIYDEKSFRFEIGKSVTVREYGSDLTFIACGIGVDIALNAAALLHDDFNVNARVVDMATIKPIDREAIIKASVETGLIVTVEEHNTLGGLGGAVCEVVCAEAPCVVERVGINDRFGRSGTPSALLEYYGLTPGEVAKRAIAALRSAGKLV